MSKRKIGKAASTVDAEIWILSPVEEFYHKQYGTYVPYIPVYNKLLMSQDEN